jgi:predicted glycosyltransferase
MKSCYNILMYSHDTYGLGHIRRTMAIALHLRDPNTNILILTGSPIVGRFDLPDQIDFVRIPGMIKKTNEEYMPLSIKIDPQHALDIRKSIILATARTFQPELFIVDKEPLGLKREILPTLQWLKRARPQTRTILGLRDVMDDADLIRQDWEEKGVYQAMAELYSEIWVYGIQDFYDPVREYNIPEDVSRKMTFTGYIPRRVPSDKETRKVRRKYRLRNGDKLVVATTGGGGDGYKVMNVFLSMLEAQPNGLPFTSVLVTGPFMPVRERDEITERAHKVGVKTWHFHQHMEELLAAADLVVTMGGYNTVCEALSQKTLSLIIPRESPRMEQLIRAKVFHDRHMVDYIPWHELAPGLLKEKILFLLAHPEPYRKAVSGLTLTGLDVMRHRLQTFKDQTP